MPVAVGWIHTIAGTGAKGYAGDGGPALQALLNEPFMCAFDAAGNLYVTEATNHCVRRIDKATGVITTVAGTGAPGLLGRWWPRHAGHAQPAVLGADRRQWRHLHRGPLERRHP